MSEETKVCTKCGEEKVRSEFYKDGKQSSGLKPSCKKCCDKKRQEWYENHREEVDKKTYKWRKRNWEEYRKKQRQWREENKKHIKRLWEEWRENNKEHRNSYFREKRRNDLTEKLKSTMRDNLYRCLKDEKKSGRTVEYFGYNYEDLKKRIEYQFTEGMSWDKVGPEIHIDHKIPVSHFLEKGETRPHVVNALSNLQPMWAEENMRKGDTYPRDLK